MAKQQRGATSKRYSEKEKQEAARLIQAGKLSIADARRKYRVAGSQTIPGWLRKYGQKEGQPEEAAATNGAPRRKVTGKKAGGKKGAARTAKAAKGPARKVQAKKASAKKAQAKKGPSKKGGAKKAGRKAKATKR
jgi:transposase-like protein